MHVAVIGAGIIGLTTARALAEAGHRVTVIDRASGPATGASGQNGAQLSYAFVAPLASPGILGQIPKLMLDPASPLRLRPGLSPDIWRWCLAFLAACTKSQSDRGTFALLALAQRSREGFDRWLAGRDPAGIDHANNGKLVIYRTEASLRAASAQLALQAGRGPAQEIVSAARCIAIEPALEGASIAGAVWTPSEEVADCARVCAALAADLAMQPGCTFRWGQAVTGWDREGANVGALRLADDTLPADVFVVCAGAGAAGLLKPLGVRVPVQPLKGYSIDLPAALLRRMPVASVTDAAAKIVFAPLGTGASARLRVAGFAELVGHDLRIPPGRIETLLAAVDRVFGLGTDVGAADVKPWAGLRPATPTALPVIGRAGEWRNVFVNAGQGALGFTLAFGSAAVLAAALGVSPDVRRRAGDVPAAAAG